ncbi:MAG TPA: hypothetical protein VKI64_02680 [Acidimicrobiales bacterium]|nr:hypothetical protein [Acidimicrobiales bacterium]
MPTVEELSSRFAALCVPVPSHGPGVCKVCHAWCPPGRSMCPGCACVLTQVTRPCHRVLPVTLCGGRSRLHRCLRAYKDDPEPEARWGGAVVVAALLARFLHDHRTCVAGDHRAWDFLTTVPSSEGRRGAHPLERAVALVPWLSHRHLPALEPGPAALAHRVARDGGFRLVVPVTGARVVVVDDVFATGARAQSAASALTLGGATVVAVVPLARIVAGPGAPAFETRAWQAWSRQQPFRFDTCCAHSPDVPPARNFGA